jgi:hypothetical protein
MSLTRDAVMSMDINNPLAGWIIAITEVEIEISK